MKRLFHLLFLLAFVSVGLFFGSLNQVPTTVDFFLLTVEWPLALALASFFFSGALFGGVVSWVGTWLASRKRLQAAREEIRQAKEAQAMVPVSQSRESG